MINKAIDFLTQVEGYKNNYYIPTYKGRILENSGITIGLGIDLGQHSAKELLNLGLECDTICKFHKALGVKGNDTINIKHKLDPLDISEVSKLSVAFVKKGLDKLKSKLGKVYEELPEEVIIVALSLYHQFGSRLFKYNAFKQIKNKDYKGLLANLRNFGCNYPTRRNKEADYLEKALKEQGLL